MYWHRSQVSQCLAQADVAIDQVAVSSLLSGHDPFVPHEHWSARPRRVVPQDPGCVSMAGRA